MAAKCTLEQSASLCGQAGAEESPADRAAFLEEVWALVSSVLPLLTTRMDNNMLLPGRCTKEEVDFFKRFTVAKIAAHKAPPLSARGLQLIGFGVGHAVAMSFARRVLTQFVNGDEPSSAALAFVLRAVDMVRACVQLDARLVCKQINDAFIGRCFKRRTACDRLLWERTKRACFHVSSRICFVLQSLTHVRVPLGVSCADLQTHVLVFCLLDMVLLILSSTRFASDGRLQRLWP